VADGSHGVGVFAALEGGMDAFDSGALFSPCRRWRYILWRHWDREKGVCVFIGLNPSTADELLDDPTIRRCVGFAKAWGYGAMWVLNAFAYRATQPADMKAQFSNALGPQNNEYLIAACRGADLVVACWGVHGAFLNRSAELTVMLIKAGVEVHHLGRTKDGLPRHPLYLPGDTLPVLLSSKSPLRAVAPPA
jgi:hypothetical protein